MKKMYRTSVSVLHRIGFNLFRKGSLLFNTPDELINAVFETFRGTRFSIDFTMNNHSPSGETNICFEVSLGDQLKFSLVSDALYSLDVAQYAARIHTPWSVHYITDASGMSSAVQSVLEEYQQELLKEKYAIISNRMEKECC